MSTINMDDVDTMPCADTVDTVLQDSMEVDDSGQQRLTVASVQH